MIKVLIPSIHNDIHKDSNPFCGTLVDAILSKNIRFIFGLNPFWTEECFSCDVVHIMWPQFLLLSKNHDSNDLKKRFIDLRNRNIKIIATCHNFLPHYSNDEEKKRAYELTYQYANTIVHLGEYSYSCFRDSYPNTNNVIIPHHVYDLLYTNLPKRSDGIRILGLDTNRHYIISMGNFRNKEERDLLQILDRYLDGTNYSILAPSYYRLPFGRKNPFVWIKSIIGFLTARSKVNNVICSGHYVTDDMLPYYYAVSDISFIQRKQILNSGNVPMGIFMGTVVVGPNTGNVGQLLKDYNYPTFDPENETSVFSAIKTAMSLAQLNVRYKSRERITRDCSTKKCAEMYYKLYINEL